MTTPTRGSLICWQPPSTAPGEPAGHSCAVFSCDREIIGKDGTPIAIDPERSLAQTVYLSGAFYPPPLCSGLGTCGQCRMRILEKLPPPHPGDLRFFSTAELGMGWRLGCLHRPAPDMLVALPPAKPVLPDGPALHEVGGLACNEQQGACQPFLAIDLGTTSLQWVATDGIRKISGSRVNPQMGAGGDVVSRLAYAATGKGMGLLHALTCRAVSDIVQEIQGSGLDPLSIVLAANPAMTAIALGLGSDSAKSLGQAPYALPPELLPGAGNPHQLPDLPPLWAVPALAPFVGGDIAAGYLALKRGQNQPSFPFLLADMGTNGEFLLALAPDRAIIGSVALGPALEGASLSFGAEARPPVVTSFVLTPQGLEPVQLRSGSQGPPLGLATPGAQGISGTGYLSLLHRLRLARALREDGTFWPQAPLLARQRAALEALAVGQAMPDEPCWPLPGGMYLKASDVEEILKVKAAFNLGLVRLLREAGLDWHDLSAVYLAGALGRYVDPAALETLGFIPPGAKVRAVGNTSLAGAVALGRAPHLWQELEIWARGVACLHLAEDAYFSRNYVANMTFSFVTQEIE